MINNSSPRMYNFAKKHQITGIVFLFLVFAFTGLHTNIHDQTASAAQGSTTVPQTGVLELAPEKTNTLSLVETKPVKTAPMVAPKAMSHRLTLQISSIGLNVPLGKTTLDSTGHLKVPTNPQTAAWYSAGPTIGKSGTALITGHLDSAAGPGIFINLRKIKTGDHIKVTSADGSVAVFSVGKLESYAQDATFPWSQVYSETGPASLRIITCDGVYNPTTKHYSKNLVVYASLISLD